VAPTLDATFAFVLNDWRSKTCTLFLLIPEIEIRCAANLRLEATRDKFLEESAARADELPARNNYDGEAVWRRIQLPPFTLDGDGRNRPIARGLPDWGSLPSAFAKLAINSRNVNDRNDFNRVFLVHCHGFNKNLRKLGTNLLHFSENAKI